MKKALFMMIALAVVLAYSAPVMASGMKVAYVDLQRALLEVKEGKTAKSNLKVYFDQKQKMLDKQSEELKKQKEDLDRQGMTIDPAIKASKEAALQKAMVELQKLYYTLQNELKQKEGEAVQPIFEKMQVIIQEIAERDGYDLVLDKNSSGIVYAPMKYDLTTELIRFYDKKYPAK